ncbi:hypothetical protein GHT06_019941 [Daphnia sinensis]|uniref:Peptidase A2 domain-containing protein n=1 Tax=Daphnia sinensis TaxID=1820382 RepID=A0AAD5PR27_9CRUS|nr:hypothetical protein GHT06_019941 [Daphnia sinensis]
MTEVPKAIRKNGMIFLDIQINGHSVEFLFDSGAHWTIVSNRVWRDIGMPTMQPSNIRVYSATHTHVPSAGILEAEVGFGGETTSAPLMISTSDDTPNLLGRNWIPLLLDFDMNQLLYQGVVLKRGTQDLQKKFRLLKHMRQSVWSNGFFADVKCRNANINMLIDTGPHVTSIGTKLWKKLGQPPLSPAPKLWDMAGVEIPIRGQFTTSIEYEDQEVILLPLLVHYSDDPAVLGIDWLESGLNLNFNEIFHNLHFQMPTTYTDKKQSEAESEEKPNPTE